MATLKKVLEIAVTDERGESHTLRSAHGLSVVAPENGALHAHTLGGTPQRFLTMAPGRWIGYRLTFED
jgi:hypothetical protein